MAAHAGAPKRDDGWTAGAICAALAISVLALYAQTHRFEFINLDDYHFLVYRPIVRSGLTWDGFRWAMSSVEADWHPLMWLSHMLDFSVFGPDPGPQHLVNAGLHAANGVLLFLTLRALSRALWPSALVAALFALHPLRAESVAWLSERKDVLSGLFWMLTLLAYAAFARRPSAARYALVGAAVVLGLMSKTMLVTLPFVLLLLDLWPLGRLRLAGNPLPDCAGGPAPAAAGGDAHRPLRVARLVLEKLPLVAIAAAASGLTVLAQQSMDAFRSLDQMSTAWRVVNAPLAYGTYLYQTLWPTRLAVIYPHPAMIAGTRLGDYLWPAAGATVLLASVTVLCVAAARRRPYLLVGWLWYLVTLVPVVGVVQVGHQSHADRYTYLPMIGVYIMVAWGLRDAIARWPGLRVPAVGGGALVLVALAALSWGQIGTWQNSRRLFEHAIAVTDDNYYASSRTRPTRWSSLARYSSSRATAGLLPRPMRRRSASAGSRSTRAATWPPSAVPKASSAQPSSYGPPSCGTRRTTPSCASTWGPPCSSSSATPRPPSSSGASPSSRRTPPRHTTFSAWRSPGRGSSPRRRYSSRRRWRSTRGT